VKPASVEVYRNARTGIYSVQPLWQKPTGGLTDQGHPILVSEEAFDRDIVGAVLEALDMFERTFDIARCVRLSDGEYRRFIKDNEAVFVERSSSGSLELRPLARTRGGYEGTGRIITIRPPEVPGTLARHLREAFELAATDLRA
jgi:hypothetical protein